MCSRPETPFGPADSYISHQSAATRVPWNHGARRGQPFYNQDIEDLDLQGPPPVLPPFRTKGTIGLAHSDEGPRMARPSSFCSLFTRNSPLPQHDPTAATPHFGYVVEAFEVRERADRGSDWALLKPTVAGEGAENLRPMAGAPIRTLVTWANQGVLDGSPLWPARTAAR